MSQNNVNDCNANLTAGFIDLATYDELENTCMVAPMPLLISSVKPVNLLGSLNALPYPKSNGTPEFGAEWSCTISRAGDYLLWYLASCCHSSCCT